MSIAALRVVTPPETLPLTLTDAKGYLRVSHTLDDQQISDLIAAATGWAETELRRKLVTQTVQIYSDTFPLDGRTHYWNNEGVRTTKYGARRAKFELPGGNVQAVNQIDYVDELGALQTLTGPTSTPPGTDYQEDLTDTFCAIVSPQDDSSWPTINYGVVNAVRIEYVVGWDVDDIPADIKQALRVKIADMYTNRGTQDKSSSAASDLLFPHRVFAA